MQMTDLLAQMGDIQSVARDLGVSQGDVATGADALLPAILGGFKKQARSSPVGGPQGLAGLLGQLGGSASFTRCCHPAHRCAPEQRRAGADIWLQRRQLLGGAERLRTDRAGRGHAQADAADAGHAGGGLYGQTGPRGAQRETPQVVRVAWRECSVACWGVAPVLPAGGGPVAGRHAGHERRRQRTGDILRMASKAMR